MLQKFNVCEQYEKDGFAIFRNVIDKDLIEEARHHVNWLAKKYPDLRPEHWHHPLMRDDAFWVRLVTDDKLLDIVELFLGCDIACFTSHYICKPPFDGQPVLWHQDGAYWKLQPMEAITLWLAIDESTPENGCLKMIPGSHKLPLQKPELRTKSSNMLFSSINTSFVESLIKTSEVIDVVLQPGDVSIHHPQMIHCSERNTSPKRRCGLDIGYIKSSTHISNRDLYLDPILVRGNPVEGINNYRMLPEYDAQKTISFQGYENWNDKIKQMNITNHCIDTKKKDEVVMDIALRMIQRLREGSLKE
ncbi:MAG: phytanoyl-CoA dioxygenase family protein [Cyanobacteria bacterium P01_D01_bin.116]